MSAVEGAMSERDAVGALLSVESVAERLQRWFAARPAARCMVVFDPSVRDARDDEDAGDAIRAHQLAEIAVPSIRLPRLHRPYLLPLDLTRFTDSELLHASIRMAFEDRDASVIGRSQGHRVGGWLTSDAPAGAVAHHLARHTVQGQTIRLPFRFYDMRCLTWLWPLLRQDQQRTLLGPVMAWHLLDPMHQLTCFTPSPGEAAQEQLSLDAGQWQAIARMGSVNRALATYQHLSGNVPTRTQLDAAWSAAGRALELGLEDVDDRAALLLCALQHHPLFDTHPKVRSLLAKRAPGQSFQLATADLDESDITHIAQELNRTPLQGEH